MRSREEFEKLVYEKAAAGRLKKKRRKKILIGTLAALVSVVVICIPIFPQIFRDKADGIENSSSYGTGKKNVTDAAESVSSLQSVVYSEGDIQRSVPVNDKNKSETERLFDLLQSLCDRNPASRESDAAPLCSVRFDFVGGEITIEYRIYNGFISDGTDCFVLSDTDRIHIEKKLNSLGLIDE